MKALTHLFLGLLLLIGAPVIHAAEPGQPVVIQVSGMTCPFCVYGVKKQLEKLPVVAEAQVSLDRKLARITPRPGQTLDLTAIRKAITDAGFTPGKLLSGEAGGPQ